MLTMNLQNLKQENDILNDQNNADYGEGNENSETVKFETKFIISNLCDYSDAQIFATGNITAIGGDNSPRVAFKNSPPFTKYMTHINDEDIDNANNLDIIVPMNNFIDSENYSDTSGSLQQFKRDEQSINNGVPVNVITTN